MSKAEILEIIYSWKYFWMQEYASQGQHFLGAALVDANMIEDLASKIAAREALKEFDAKFMKEEK